MPKKASGEISLMTPTKRPLAVTILAWVYIAVGTIGFASHSRNFLARYAFDYDDVWIELTEALAIVCGVLNAPRTQLGALACARLDGIPRDPERL
jgi:hypothetical protein